METEIATQTHPMTTRLPRLFWLVLVVVFMNFALLAVAKWTAQSDARPAIPATQALAYDSYAEETKPSPFGGDEERQLLQRAKATRPRPMVPVLQPAIDFAVATVQEVVTTLQPQPVQASTVSVNVTALPAASMPRTTQRELSLPVATARTTSVASTAYVSGGRN